VECPVISTNEKQNYGSPLPLKPSKKKLQVGLVGISFDANYVEDVRI
jgi:hypothetical protein